MYGDNQLAETASLSTLCDAIAPRRLSGAIAIRSAVLQCFCDPLPAQCEGLKELTARDWKQLLHWLDISGLALYFFDRINELGLSRWLPPATLARLEQNLEDNTERTRDLIAECNAIQVELQRADLAYAVLKGFSLSPHSVPKPELRSQLDLDFLVAENAAGEARRILEARGYRLHLISGQSWEFKTEHPAPSSIAHLYKAHPHRSVELHVESAAKGDSLLARREMREFHGVTMPVLPAVDLFLWQGLHAFKHVSSEFSRASHLVEFRRHVLARRQDGRFWKELESRAGDSPRMYWALGAVTLLIESLMDDFAPHALTSWTRDRLPGPVRLWVERFGRRTVLGSFPGNKTFLLLQRELEIAGIPAKRTLRQHLLPLKLPPVFEHPREHESLPERLRRSRTRLRFLFFRLRFHLVSGIRFAWVAARWRKQRQGHA
jgi:hypothetical protein